MKIRYFFVLYLICLSTTCYCQNGKKNSLYGTLGVFPEESYINFLGNYERMIFQLPNSFFQSFWLRIGSGPWRFLFDQHGGHGINYVSTISTVMGKRGSHIELGAGILFTYNSQSKKFDPLVNNSYLAGNIGFRYQKNGEDLVFAEDLVLRIGLGLPEGIYLSIGLCF